MTRVSVVVFLDLVACLASLLVQPLRASGADEPQEKINGRDLSVLVEMLNNKEARQQRQEAMTDIARYAEKPAQFIPAYRDALKDPDQDVRVSAARSLGEMGKRFPSLAGDIVPALTESLSDPQQQVRQFALLALKEMGPAGRSALPDVRNRYKEDKSKWVRQAAMEAIIALTQGSDDYLDALLQAVNQNEFPAGGEWLVELAVASRNVNAPEPAVAALTRKLQDKAVGNREMAAKGLGILGTAAKPSVPKLLELLREPIQYETAIIGGGGVEDAGTKVRIPVVNRLRVFSAAAITMADPASADEVFSVLATQLGDANADMRISTLIVIGRLSYLPKAQKVRDSVKQLNGDKDPDVSSFAKLSSLRLADPESTPELDWGLNEMPAPDDGMKLPGTGELKQQLHAKLDRLTKLLDADDVRELMRSFWLPTDYERAMLDGMSDHIDEFSARARAGIKILLTTIDRDAIQIDGRKAIVTSQYRGRTKKLLFVWFSGDWYLADG